MQAGAHKRIAILFEYPSLNGGERSMLAVLDTLQEEELQFVILAPGEGPLSEAVQARGLEFIPVRFRDDQGQRLPREEILQQLKLAVRESRADLLHANSLAMGRLTGAMAAELTISCIAHLRDILRLSRAAINDLNGNAKLLAVSQATRDFHCEQGLTDERSVVVYNGIDTSQFCPQSKSGWLHQELGLPESSQLVATIGQIGLRKGQDVLAAAARQLSVEFPDVHYLLIGERNSVKQENLDFERALGDQFPAQRLHRLGRRQDVPPLLTQVDLLVHPARQEPFGRVLLEAAACGLPIVATDVGGTAEMLIHGESALLVPKDDATALAAGMAELLTDGEKRRRLATAARSRVEAEFSVVRAARYLAIWRELLRPRP